MEDLTFSRSWDPKHTYVETNTPEINEPAFQDG